MTQRQRNVFLVVFLTVQLLVPLRGFIWDKYESEGSFSWNMYSKSYGCTVTYYTIGPDRKVHGLNLDDYFNRPRRVSMTMHRASLVDLHRYLCGRLKEEGRLGTLRGSVECQLNRQPVRQLIATNGDVCTAPNFGVVEP